MDYSSPTRIAKLPGLPQVLMRSSVPARIIDVTANHRQPANGAAPAATAARARTRSAVPLQHPEQPVGPVAHSISSQASSNQQTFRQQGRQAFKLPVQPKLYKNPPQNQNPQRRAVSSSPKHHPQQHQPNSHSCSPPTSNQHRASHSHHQSQPSHQPLGSGPDHGHHVEARHYREVPVQQTQRRAVSSSPTLASDPNLEEIKTQLQRLSKQVESLAKIYHQTSGAPQPIYQAQPLAQPQPQPQFQPPPPQLNLQQRYQPPQLEPLPTQFYQPQQHAYSRPASAAVQGDHYHYLSDQKQRHLNNCCNCHHKDHGEPPTTKKRVDPEEELLADMSMASKEYFRRYNLD